MRNIHDLIKEHDDYVAEVTEAVRHWVRFGRDFEEAWEMVDRYDYDLRNMTHNDKWDIRREVLG